MKNTQSPLQGFSSQKSSSSPASCGTLPCVGPLYWGSKVKHSICSAARSEPEEHSLSSCSYSLSPRPSDEGAMDSHSKAQPWNPKLILCQIIAMQCFYYISLGIALAFSHILFGTTLSLEHFFTAKHMNPASAAGWIGIACTVFAALVG